MELKVNGVENIFLKKRAKSNIECAFIWGYKAKAHCGIFLLFHSFGPPILLWHLISAYRKRMGWKWDRTVQDAPKPKANSPSSLFFFISSLLFWLWVNKQKNGILRPHFLAFPSRRIFHFYIRPKLEGLIILIWTFGIGRVKCLGKRNKPI